MKLAGHNHKPSPCPSWLEDNRRQRFTCEGTRNHAGLHYMREHGMEIVWDNSGHYTAAPIGMTPKEL